MVISVDGSSIGSSSGGKINQRSRAKATANESTAMLKKRK